MRCGADIRTYSIPPIHRLVCFGCDLISHVLHSSLHHCYSYSCHVIVIAYEIVHKLVKYQLSVGHARDIFSRGLLI